ncbi:MAG: hypothetical protein IJV43_02740 [Oscillospiraceae bacterium]|nr:hypothetical protein [Oscillospiraceae bacterium]
MADEPKLSWGETPRDLPERWPKQDDGMPEAPAFLTHLMEWNYEVDLLEQMLRAYDIPVLKARGNFGSLGKIVFGFSGEGVDLFVPASLLDDAQNLLRPVDEAELDAEFDN